MVAPSRGFFSPHASKEKDGNILLVFILIRDYNAERELAVYMK
jgi:hypothetical protein